MMKTNPRRPHFLVVSVTKTSLNAGRTILLGALFSLGCGSSASPSTETEKKNDELPPTLCERDSHCDDGDPCNGEESCSPKSNDAEEDGCAPGTPVECESDHECDDASGECVAVGCDEDRDGHDRIECGGDDCDDEDPNRFPGNVETCTDPITGELDETTAVHDEDCDPNTLGSDDDNDGFYAKSCANRQEDGVPLFGLDCDDNNDLRRPGFAEICDGLDNDCVGGLDFPGEDDDGDGFADCEDLRETERFDCNDANAAIHPGATELCDGVDQDCDGEIEDEDEDGYVAEDAMCMDGPLPKTDCDDDAPLSSPDALELCNGADDDCSGTVDDNGAELRSCGSIGFFATPSCEGECLVTCEDGYEDCDSDPSNGCETHVTVDRRNCGACGADSCPFGCDDGSCLGIVKVSNGFLHSCALVDDGNVYCWGGDALGQIGNGDEEETPRFSPTFVLGLRGAAVDLDVGQEHACAVLADGRIMCWGADLSGALGDGDESPAAADPETQPVEVVGISNAVAVAAGASHTCARLADASVVCWGSDLNGNVGNGDDGGDPKHTPVSVRGIDGVAARAVAISAGLGHSCAILETGTVRCWGQDTSGQLGDGPDANENELAPVTVVGITSAAIDLGEAALSLGDTHSCVVLQDRTVQCWGSDEFGKLGDGDDAEENEDSPVFVSELAGATSVAAGNLHTCATTSSGQAYCWGGDLVGHLGDGDDDSQPAHTPNPVPPFDGLEEAAIGITAGTNGSCTWNAFGRAWCWGDDFFGGVGDGNDDQNTELGPSTVAPIPQARNIVSLGSRKEERGRVCNSCVGACGVGDDGSLHCWGRGESIPSPMAGVSNALSIAMGADHQCLLLTTGKVKCWGRDGFGQLGDGDDGQAEDPAPGTDLDIERVVQVVAGSSHTCALLFDRTVMCWGSDSDGQLGDGDDDSQPEFSPVPVPNLTEVVRLAAGTFHTCALLQSGQVHCWGRDASGQLGDGVDDGANEPAPVAVVGLDNATSLSAGKSHTCATLTTGEVKCWGRDEEGQMGDGEEPFPASDEESPVLVTGLSDAINVALGDRFACALRSNGAVACWGAPTAAMGDGQIFSGNRHVPVDVLELPVALVELNAGQHHLCGRSVDGRVYCWGQDIDGSLGIGPLSEVTGLPTRVFETWHE